MSVLVLGLGNELAGDDAVGLLVVRAVRDQLARTRAADFVEVVESSASGMALLEFFDGHDYAVVVDAIMTGRDAPGTIGEMGMDEVGRVVAPSVHQAGLPELAAVASRMGLSFPSRTRVLAVEVADPFTLGAPISAPVAAAVPELVRRVRELAMKWAAEEAARCTTTTPSRF
jgi:hydrogenase maturation protease